MHQRMAAALDEALDEIAAIQERRARRRRAERPRWPMIVLRTPKGWTGPKEVDGLPVEGTWRSHQVPLSGLRGQPGAPRAARGVDAQLPARGALRRRRRAARRARRARARGRAADGRQPARQRRPAAARPASCRTSATTRSTSRRPARTTSEATRVLGAFLRDVDRAPTRRALPALRARRDRVEPAQRACSRRPTASGRRERLDTDDHLAPRRRA